MSTFTPEQKARQQIDAMLVASGWVIQDYKAADFSAGRGIVLREVPLKSGPCDYLRHSQEIGNTSGSRHR